jgi:hypothetical protein
MKIRFDVSGIQWTGKKWGLSKSMDVDHGLTRTLWTVVGVSVGRHVYLWTVVIV